MFDICGTLAGIGKNLNVVSCDFYYSVLSNQQTKNKNVAAEMLMQDLSSIRIKQHTQFAATANNNS